MPALIVKVAGLKAKEPLLSVMIMTVWALPACVAVAVGVLVVPVVGVAAGVLVVPVVGVVPVLVELPPQAARSTSALSATRQNKTGLRCFLAVEIPKVIDLFKSIFFFFPKGITLANIQMRKMRPNLSHLNVGKYYFNYDHILHIRVKVTIITHA